MIPSILSVDDEAKKAKSIIDMAMDGGYKSLQREIKGPDNNEQWSSSETLAVAQLKAKEEKNGAIVKCTWEFVKEKKWIGKKDGETKEIDFSNVTAEVIK